MASKSSDSGLNTNQLYLMRLMLQQQKPTPLSVQPVQDVGGGIMQGVGNIANAIQQRKAERMQSQMLQSYLAQEQAAEQAAQLQAQQVLQARAQSWVASGGKPEEAMSWALQPDAVFNKGLEGLQGVATDARKPGVAGQTKAAEVLGEGQGKITLNKAVGNVDVNTPQGQNMFRMINGFDPHNSYSSAVEKAGAGTAATNLDILNYQAPYLKQQPLLQNDSTIANTQGKRIENQYAPAQQQATLEGKTTENQVQGFTLQRLQRQQVLDQGLQAGTITPQQYYQGTIMNSANPVSSLSEIGGNKNLNGFGLNKPQGMVAPQAPAPQAQGAAPTTLLNFQPAGDAFHQYQQLSPQDQANQAGAYRDRILQGIGQGFAPADQAIRNMFHGTESTLQGGANLIFPSWLTGAGQQQPTPPLNDPYAAPPGWFR